ncbi:unnamed protein product [Rodentolepis nana]|uniref:Ovule protein n=1 Tax=Rodentolepis nana TaxID=102285 RepID=A0A0R3T7U9_RODNA|nr:unnamed protein product [Rodentolepis nana]
MGIWNLHEEDMRNFYFALRVPKRVKKPWKLVHKTAVAVYNSQSVKQFYMLRPYIFILGSWRHDFILNLHLIIPPPFGPDPLADLPVFFLLQMLTLGGNHQFCGRLQMKLSNVSRRI